MGTTRIHRRVGFAAFAALLVGGLLPLVGVAPAASAAVFTPNVFGMLQTDATADPATIGSIEIFEVSATGSPSTLVRTRIAQSTGDDSVSVSDDTFAAYVNFRQGFTYEMDVTPVDSNSGATTTFRLPGPAGDADYPMAFRLESPRNIGLYAMTRQWACRADNDVNCVESLRARTTAGPGSWVNVDDSTYYPTYECDPAQSARCFVSNDGSGRYQRWDAYQTWDAPTIGAVPAQEIRVQFVYRPENERHPEDYDYPFITIEVAEQVDGADRDGWGCTTLGDNDTWWAPGDSWDDTPYPTWLTEVEATYGCWGNAPLERDLDYEITLRTAEETFTPLFTAGYLAGMDSALEQNVDDSSYSMTISGAPRAWQWLGGDVWREADAASDDSTSYANYFDATNWEWSFSTYDGRNIAADNPAIEPCVGQGMAATSTNGNGGYVPTWDYETQSLRYNTDGRHFMPANIDDSGAPTEPTSAGLVYIGKAEIVVPTPLALCMWADAGFTTVADLQNLAGQVRSGAGSLKGGATVELAADDTALYVNASGYTYSTAALVVAPTVGTAPLGVDAGSVTVGDESFGEFEVRNNDDSDPFTFSAAPSITGADAASFSVVQGRTACYDDSVTLQPGETCYVAFRFAPVDVGSLSATLSLTTSPTLGGPHEVFVGGTGVAAPIPPTPPAPVPASAPTGVTAEAGNASASVSWSAPASSGSYAISTYQVTSSPGGMTCSTSTTSCIVEGLANGTSYTFTVQALTGAGWSPASKPSNAVTPSAPVSPTITITGSREGRVVTVAGTSTGLEMGAVLEPWFRFPGQREKTQGKARVLVGDDGTFEWQRRTGKKIYVVFRTPDGAVSSNQVVIGLR